MLTCIFIGVVIQLLSRSAVMKEYEENFQFVKAYLALHIPLYAGIHKTSNHPK